MRHAIVLHKLATTATGYLLALQAFAQAAPDDVETQHLAIPSSAASIDAGTGSIQFIGTATVLIRYQGVTILTDPNFLHKGEHVHLGYGLRSKRLTDPALELSQLPPINLVVLSHFHEDHFDPPGARASRP